MRRQQVARGWTIAEVPETTAGERLEMALELFEMGEQIMLQNLRRRHPQASEAEITERLAAWLRTRPGAEHGDSVGKLVEWSRQKA